MLRFNTPKGDYDMLFYAFLVIAAAIAALYVCAAGGAIWAGALVFVGAFAGLVVLFVLVIGLLTLNVDKTKPIEKQNRICRWAIVSATGLMLQFFEVRTHVTGAEKLPKGRYVFISNHRSAFDPLIVFNKLAQCDLGFISKPSNMALPVVGKVAYGAGCLGIDRENDRNALKTIIGAANYLKNDVCSIGIYPEGTRSHSSKLLEFHAGSFKIAQKANVPVVVSSIRGSEGVTKRILRGSDVYIDILEVIPAQTVKSEQTHELAEHCKGLIESHLAECEA